jgi:hypothetical protein
VLASVAPNDNIIDVGGGASTIVDFHLESLGGKAIYSAGMLL